MRILLVEENKVFAGALSADLHTQGVRVDIAETGDDALHFMRAYEFDLILLNLRLPDMDGSTLISRIRLAKHATPLIALSSVAQARLKALAAGADDVVERDIDSAELSARIRAVIRRSRGFSHSQLRVGNLTLDVDQHDVVANGVRVHLTKKEFDILELLVLRRNTTLTKEAILNCLYGGRDTPEPKIIDVFICKIRSKLAKAGMPDIVGTVWGRGYIVRETGSDAPAIIPRPQPARREAAFA